jgi:hypothetical protein
MNFGKPLIVALLVAYASATGNNTTPAPQSTTPAPQQRVKPILTADQIAAVRAAAAASVDTCLTSGKKARECAKAFKETLKAQKATSNEKLNRGQAYAEFKQAVAEVVFKRITKCLTENNNNRKVCFQKATELGLARGEIKKLLIRGADGKAADEFRACKKAATTDDAKTVCKNAAKEKLKAAFPQAKLTDDEAEREMKKGLAKEAVVVFKKCMADSTTSEEKDECVAARKEAKPDWISKKEAKFYFRRAAWAIALDTYHGCMVDEVEAGTAAVCGDAAQEDYLAAGGKPLPDFVTKLMAKYADKDKVKVLRKVNKIALSLEIEGLTKAEVIAKLAAIKAKINADTGATFGDGSALETTTGSVDVDFGDSPCTDCAAQLTSVNSNADASANAALTSRRRLLEATTATASSEQSLEEVIVEDGDWEAEGSAAAGLALTAATVFALQFLV